MKMEGERKTGREEGKAEKRERGKEEREKRRNGY